ncbi:MAG: hypothetical protein KDI79_20605 [Anaerolineae bacterium]|nr:hypothetical protein [Anaerolineae bacterium]
MERQLSLEAIGEQIQRGQTILGQKLGRWSLKRERLAEEVRQTQVKLNAVRQSLPGPNALLLKSGLIAGLYGYFFGTQVGRILGAGEIGGAVLTAILVVIGLALWFVLFKQRQLRRA